MKMADSIALMVQFKRCIRTFLSEPAKLKRQRVLDERGCITGFDLKGCHEALSDCSAMLIWTPHAFEGPGFSNYVYFSWEQEQLIDEAMLGIIPASDMGLTREDYHSLQPAEWNSRVVAGTLTKFMGAGYESGHVMMHEIAHLIHGRKASEPIFREWMDDHRFLTKRYAYMPEQFADLISGIAVTLQAVGADGAAEVKRAHPTAESFIKAVMAFHDWNSSKPMGSQPRKHQIRRLTSLYDSLINDELQGKAY